MSREQCEELWAELEFDTGHILREIYRTQKIHDVLRHAPLRRAASKWKEAVRRTEGWTRVDAR